VVVERGVRGRVRLDVVRVADGVRRVGLEVGRVGLEVGRVADGVRRVV